MMHIDFFGRARVGLALLAPSAFAALLCTAGTAAAQVIIGGEGSGEISAVCSADGRLYVTVDSDDCGGGLDFYPQTGLRVGSTTTGTTFAMDGTATFNANTTTFNGRVVSTNLYNGGLVSTGRLEVFNGAKLDALSVTNRTTMNVALVNTLSVTNGTDLGALTVTNNTLLRGALTVNQQAALNGGANIGGTTNVAALAVAGGLSVAPGAAVDMGGNRITNIGAPVAATDAANRGYVDANIATANAQAAALDGRVTVVDGRVTQVDGRVTQVDGRVTALDQRVTNVAAVQGAEILAITEVNSTQAGQIASLQSLTASQGGQISAVQQVNAVQASQISDLQTGQAALFDLAAINRREVGKANEGVALALAMESPALPPGTSFALSGGVGYYQNRTAATTAVSARIGRNASASAGVGVGLNTGEVGARGGFQVAW
jgi:hypothetical protein